jgi:hypothetical protein
MSILGSCLCGGIRYEVDSFLGLPVNCHCSMCRKATGRSVSHARSGADGGFPLDRG